ncbi:hypothetical protein [Xenorhabdus cabanillasii]|uniref:Uncharacterized protein n=1 Tax=Xenorhabdus cabanillasii JM26 TaxID=1427517 RepID=W1IXI7_9GAMM|nr:hypothetical protein [Xenorhabdus cabanillasii]PHM75486.1 hypothetical protein Xcab_04046 [Xenorhabdus cabanillasii JM26]CDL82336.1 hypothetical protein XCR1_1660001 [Xenorhabdus cabanillasii JM26]
MRIQALCSVFVGNKLLKRDIGAGSKYRQEEHYFSIKIISGNDIKEIEVNGRSISNSFRSQYEKNKFRPKKIITVSTSPFDKFPEERVYFSSRINDDDDSFYNYYGLNESSKNKAVLSLIEKLFFSAAKGSLNKDQYTIPKVLSFLGFESRFELHFRLKHGINKFMDNLYEMNIGQFMTYVSSAAQRELNFLKNKYDITYSKLRDAFVSLYEYCNKTDSSRVIIFEIDYSKNQVDDYFKKFLSDIKILSDIGILNIYDVIVRSSKNNDEEKESEVFFMKKKIESLA